MEAVMDNIITHDFALARKRSKELYESCPVCGKEGHDADARFCKSCGASLLH